MQDLQNRKLLKSTFKMNLVNYCFRSMGQTGGQTETRPLRRSCTAYHAGSVKKQHAAEAEGERICRTAVARPRAAATNINKAVIDRRLRPRCCHQGNYFKRPKSSPVRPLACDWCYCARFVAKPKAACAMHFSWAATSSNLGL